MKFSDIIIPILGNSVYISGKYYMSYFPIRRCENLRTWGSYNIANLGVIHFVMGFSVLVLA